MWILKVSFVGFSLGGIIIRAALPYLDQLSEKFYTFVSLASPHLGYLFNSSILFDTGMWFIQMWKSSESLKQLAFKDADKIEDTFLFQLSKKPGLNMFSNVVLVTATQDLYVPFESASVQITKLKLDDDYKRKLMNYQIQMAHNLMHGLAVGRP